MKNKNIQMKPSPALAPTVTHRVRSFLAAQGVFLKPWTGLDETFAELYALLMRRRNDPSFWKPVADLIQSVVACASEPGSGRLPAPDAELLASWDIERLVIDLREALPASDEPSDADALGRFTRRLPAPVLGGFLLLGLVASGCYDSSQRAGDASMDPDVEAVADVLDAHEADRTDPVDIRPDPVDIPPEVPWWAEGCTLDRSGVLFRTLASSTIDGYDKQTLCTCFTHLNASWSDGLSELFETGTPEQVAFALEEMLECCWSGGPFGGDFDDVRDALLDGTLCSLPLPYRGVSFPERPR
jgi:hypothetical protein